jgi:hypothetical protein
MHFPEQAGSFEGQCNSARKQQEGCGTGRQLARCCLMRWRSGQVLLNQPGDLPAGTQNHQSAAAQRDFGGPPALAPALAHTQSIKLSRHRNTPALKLRECYCAWGALRFHGNSGAAHKDSVKPDANLFTPGIRA